MTRTLEAAVYWQLRALCAEGQRCELVVRLARADLVAAQQKQTAQLVALGLDPTMPSFALDDETLTVTVSDG